MSGNSGNISPEYILGYVHEQAAAHCTTCPAGHTLDDALDNAYKAVGAWTHAVIDDGGAFRLVQARNTT
jgi:hydrogenase/urease accessory protein HupE